ncbi:C2 family cysteine protease, partial [Laspinema sp. D1]|uniref:C2 family cysteine protease n=1 Tax=Laspinema palackyanum TaxID=3231601 RepID=UPI00346D4F46|nr:C2 family cysteine protease [Laspinema sp. D2b]
SQGGTDTVYVQSYDGKAWSNYPSVALTTQQVNRTPVVTTYNRTLNTGTSMSASNFFTVYDADGDAMQRYYFYDANSNSTSGYFTVNGVKQNSSFYVDGSQLGNVRFVGGSQGGTDTVYVQSYDGKAWSNYPSVALTTQQVNRAPVVTTYNQTVKRAQSITPSFTVTDADGDTITQYAIYDGNTNSNSGYFTLNGVKQSAGQTLYLNANQLSGLKFVGGSTATSDNLQIAAYDGKTWSNWSQYQVTTEAGSAPIVSIQNATVNANTAMSLNFTTSDKDGDKVTRYEIFDSNTQATSGYFTVNGVRQTAGQSFFVDADKLHTVKFVGGGATNTDPISVRATDGSDGWGAWSYANFTTQVPVTNDWFDLNIKDTTIRAFARERFQDGIFSRQEMIEIFDSAKDGGIVDTNEFADLKLLSSDVTYIKMADHARVLSQKIAHGNKANEKYLGQSSGNLYAGSSQAHLQKLIDEHFFGKDLPLAKGEYAYGEANQAAYQYVQGQLFQNGIQYTDVRQGALGDCYYLAALAGIALADPNKIKEMFIDNYDGTYTVRFFNNGRTDYVTVNRLLPTNPDGTLSFAKVGNSWNTYTNSSNELWVALAEKAYAQINEAGWIGQDGTNSYKGIEGGWMHSSVTQISNWSGSIDYLQSASQILQDFNNGKVVTFGSYGQDSTKGSPVASGHAYTMVGYNQSTGKLKLFNPWGSEGGYEYGDSAFKPGILEMTWNEIKTYFSRWTVNG